MVPTQPATGGGSWGGAAEFAVRAGGRVLAMAAGGAGAGGMGMGMGMFGGVPGMGGRRGAPGAAPEVKYDPTAWGRYAKILLSSSEFLFVN